MPDANGLVVSPNTLPGFAGPVHLALARWVAWDAASKSTRLSYKSLPLRLLTRSRVAFARGFRIRCHTRESGYGCPKAILSRILFEETVQWGQEQITMPRTLFRIFAPPPNEPLGTPTAYIAFSTKAIMSGQADPITMAMLAEWLEHGDEVCPLFTSGLSSLDRDTIIAISSLRFGDRLTDTLLGHSGINKAEWGTLQPIISAPIMVKKKYPDNKFITVPDGFSVVTEVQGRASSRRSGAGVAAGIGNEDEIPGLVDRKGQHKLTPTLI